MKHDEASTCHCHASAAPRPDPPRAAVRKTARSLPAFLLSVLIAFFPRCPVCWAAYMSMFGSVWLARAPHMAWLFPLLLAFSALHLLLLLRKSRQKGYGPFLLSLAGAAVLLIVRSLLPEHRWLLLSGMLLMVAGSLLNSFSADPLKVSLPTPTRK